MKLVQIRELKEERIYKEILNQLKVKGINNLYLKKIEYVDYLDIVISIIDFLEDNKKILKNISRHQFENIVIIIIDEILEEEFNIIISEEQVENILKLLKNSLLVKKVSNYLIDKFKKIFLCYKK
jgi:hypothetical protein